MSKLDQPNRRMPILCWMGTLSLSFDNRISGFQRCTVKNFAKRAIMRWKGTKGQDKTYYFLWTCLSCKMIMLKVYFWLMHVYSINCSNILIQLIYPFRWPCKKLSFSKNDFRQCSLYFVVECSTWPSPDHFWSVGWSVNGPLTTTKSEFKMLSTSYFQRSSIIFKQLHAVTINHN